MLVAAALFETCDEIEDGCAQRAATIEAARTYAAALAAAVEVAAAAATAAAAEAEAAVAAAAEAGVTSATAAAAFARIMTGRRSFSLPRLGETEGDRGALAATGAAFIVLALGQSTANAETPPPETSVDAHPDTAKADTIGASASHAQIDEAMFAMAVLTNAVAALRSDASTAKQEHTAQVATLTAKLDEMETKMISMRQEHTAEISTLTEERAGQLATANARLDEIQAKMTTMREEHTAEMDEVQTKQCKTESGLKHLETKQRETKSGLEQIETKQRKTDSGLEQIETKQRETDSGLEQIETKQRKTDSGLEQIETKQRQTESDLRETQRDLARIKENVADATFHCMAVKSQLVLLLEQHGNSALLIRKEVRDEVTSQCRTMHRQLQSQTAGSQGDVVHLFKRSLSHGHLSSTVDPGESPGGHRRILQALFGCDDSTLESQTQAVNSFCSDGDTAGIPTSCSTECAAVLVPLWQNCRVQLGPTADFLKDLVQTCPNIEAPALPTGGGQGAASLVREFAVVCPAGPSARIHDEAHLQHSYPIILHILRLN
jgi:hypothetical protein